MREAAVGSLSLPDFGLWKKLAGQRVPLAMDLELTARCNHNCRHCYINLPPAHRKAREKELSLEEIGDIADQAVSMGTLWCLLTGGEPLLREDFRDIYLALKHKGLLVSIFTNAALVGEAHIRLFKRYPPRDIEVSVYGVSQKVYERVTRIPGSFEAYGRGLDLLLKSGLKVRLKTMALRSNLGELKRIRQFCLDRTACGFRFDPHLHLRYDRNPGRNREIAAERLTPEEIAEAERSDPERFQSLQRECSPIIEGGSADSAAPVPAFCCGAGMQSFAVSWDGRFQLCSSLRHPGCTYDLRGGSLADAWRNFVPGVRATLAFLPKCRACRLKNLCLWCPANAYLETGRMDHPVAYFCLAAHARAAMLAAGSPGSEVKPCRPVSPAARLEFFSRREANR